MTCHPSNHSSKHFKHTLLNIVIIEKKKIQQKTSRQSDWYLRRPRHIASAVKRTLWVVLYVFTPPPPAHTTWVGRLSSWWVEILFASFLGRKKTQRLQQHQLNDSEKTECLLLWPWLVNINLASLPPPLPELMRVYLNFTARCPSTHYPAT